MKAIEVVSVPVSNQEKSKEFYEKLGFTLLNEASFGNGQEWVQLGFPGHEASVTLVTWFPAMPPGCQQGLVIKTDSLDQDMEEFTSKGIEVGKIDETPWGRFLTIKDPDGNTVSFHEA